MARRGAIPSPLTPPGQFARYGARVFDDDRHDPYYAAEKHPESTRCATCGVVYHDGRWQRPSHADSATPGSATCPACRRIEERRPAGYLSLAGSYVRAHRDELLRIVRHVADEEATGHPLNRIMRIDAEDDDIAITTTDVHLPRRIGEALRRAHDGELAITFARDDYEVRVDWRR